ncbi:prepilin-type N-terminal cleavage/methylation domain-containing protein [Clostridium cylindrosporum]|uniref:Prepilin-type N-terminal cleavage/methylation domain-containing protein n=1 Tax=Clostridium cylindrosporum DSM 605 TaxID=1121307 RepID=A0A0J8DAD7_CLOCY|nr:prepilin-type N-terminal cleavage/methylation domain-containing protein [Clostridium cylindrosporum]KMT21284.1 hypothetical protein CLCY_2c00440 [Clostridium cylindrosporum DSM 605]
MKNLRKRKKGGFTLIEMVVVIAIVVIIAAIAIPQALKAVNKSRASTDIANARAYAGQIMNRIANDDVKTVDAAGDDTENNVLKSGTAKAITNATTGTNASAGTATDLLGSSVAPLKLDDTQGWFVKYTKDPNGNDSIEILVGKAAGTAKRIYPSVDSGSEWANYVK